jgi:hypothetical protein
VQMFLERPIFPCKTIATLFSQRRHRVALQAHCQAFKRRLATQNAQSSLLALPDELLVTPSSCLPCVSPLPRFTVTLMAIQQRRVYAPFLHQIYAPYPL